jgi:DNA polymerase
MGGEHDRLTAAEAASVLGWWIEAGVDVAVQDAPRAWFGASTPTPSVKAPTAIAPDPAPELPQSLEAFRSWLGDSPTLPFAKGNNRRALPKGAESAEIMLLADMPTPEDVAEGQPIAGQAWDLTERMLAAIGFTMRMVPQHVWEPLPQRDTIKELFEEQEGVKHLL